MIAWDELEAKHEALQQEAIRKKTKGYWMLGGGFALFFMIPLFSGLLPSAVSGYSMLLMIPSIGIMVMGIVGLNDAKQNNQEIKKQIFPSIFASLGAEYSAQGKPDFFEAVKKTKLLPHFDNYYLEDYVQLNHKGVKIEFCELKLTELRREFDKNTNKFVQRERRIFTGIIASFDFPRSFQGITLVRSDVRAQAKSIDKLAMVAEKGLVNTIVDKGIQKAVESLDGVKRVTLEDPMFEKEFDVYGTDQVEARYLMNPSFMERVLTLRQTMEALIELSFQDDRLVIVLHSYKDYFEVDAVNKPMDVKAYLERAEVEISHFKAIVDTLKLDENTGL
jgi:hypothetical protein